MIVVTGDYTLPTVCCAQVRQDMDYHNDHVTIMIVLQSRGHQVLWLQRTQNDQTWLDWDKKCESIWDVSIHQCVTKL